MWRIFFTAHVADFNLYKGKKFKYGIESSYCLPNGTSLFYSYNTPKINRQAKLCFVGKT